MPEARHYLKRHADITGLLQHAYDTVPHYRAAWGEGFRAADLRTYDEFAARIPILEKASVTARSEQFISSAYDAGTLFQELTSGTEGQPLRCFKADEERLRCSMDLWRQRRRWLRTLTPRDRFARFYAFRRTDERRLFTDAVYTQGSDLHLPLFDMSEARLTEYWRAILDFQPRWMHGPSTAIFNLARATAAAPRSTLEFVELNGEHVSDAHLQVIEQTWNCRVANNYGSREFWTLAYGCPAQHLHVMDGSVFMESVWNDALGVNELLVTTLHNRAWPLIRYRIGDLGTLTHRDTCGCGRAEVLTLQLQQGRKADFFTLRGARRYNAILFSGLIRGLSQLHGETLVYQYQVRKRSDTHLEIALVINDRCRLTPLEVQAAYDQELRQVLGHDVRIDYVLTSAIEPDSRTGKARDYLDLTPEVLTS